jgi:hypothetical protein
MNVWYKPLFWSRNITGNFPSMSEMFILAQMKKKCVNTPEIKLQKKKRPISLQTSGLPHPKS